MLFCLFSLLPPLPPPPPPFPPDAAPMNSQGAQRLSSARLSSPSSSSNICPAPFCVFLPSFLPSFLTSFLPSFLALFCHGPVTNEALLVWLENIMLNLRTTIGRTYYTMMYHFCPLDLVPHGCLEFLPPYVVVMAYIRREGWPNRT